MRPPRVRRFYEACGFPATDKTGFVTRAGSVTIVPAALASTRPPTDGAPHDEIRDRP
jgi:hypothetical protein